MEANALGSPMCRPTASARACTSPTDRLQPDAARASPPGAPRLAAPRRARARAGAALASPTSPFAAILTRRSRRSRAATSRRSRSPSGCRAIRRIFLLNDPTRGVDVETKREIYLRLRHFAAEGTAVVLLELRYARAGPSLRPRRRHARGPDRRACSSAPSSPRRRSSAQRWAPTRRERRRGAIERAEHAGRAALLARPAAARTAALARPLLRASLAFLAVYAYLFPGFLSLGGIAKFAQSWFPLALVAMAQAILSC